MKRLLLMLCLAPLPVFSQDESPFTRLFDTGTAAATPLTEGAVAKRDGWQIVAEDVTNHVFAGDAVLLNDKLTVVLRKSGRGAEAYAKTAAGLKYRATLGHVRDLTAENAPFGAFKILENTASAVLMEVSLPSKEPSALRFRLTTGESIMEIRSSDGTGSVSLSSNARYVVVPDYFGDDMVYRTEAFRGGYLPAENFCLNLIDGGDAILMSVWQSNLQDTWLDARRTGAADGLCSNQIQCLPGKSIWLAFLEAPGIWRAENSPPKTDAKPPFPAKWRCSFMRDNAPADSWDLETGGSVDQIESKHQGPIIVYPIDRSSATPLTATCPTDVMRNTLGVGPCQYILAVEGMAAAGDPTPNSVMNWVEKQFEQKKARKAADDIKERLDQMTAHLTQADAKIQRYSALGKQVRQLLANQAGLDSLRAIADNLDLFAQAPNPMNSPTRGKRCADEVAALIGKDNALTACQALGAQLRSIGAFQDHALARCRMAVRRLKQESRTITKNHAPASGPVQEIQRLAEEMLVNK